MFVRQRVVLQRPQFLLRLVVYGDCGNHIADAADARLPSVQGRLESLRLCFEVYVVRMAFVVDEPWDAAVELVAKREAELKEWHDALPVLPDTRTDLRAVQGQLTLRLYCAMAQLVLYRPFVHHLSRRNSDPDFNLRGYEWGSACVKAAMQAIWLSERYQAYELFHEARWHMIYALCFSATVLTYFVTLSTQTATVKESATAALNARRMLGDLGQYNMVARRCYSALNGLMNDLPVSWEGLQDDVEMR